jgi:hypothetical protein
MKWLFKHKFLRERLERALYFKSIQLYQCFTGVNGPTLLTHWYASSPEW